ncbi:MAG TPA: LysM peptidoglycan-binding domain-containing protein, partial [Luteolibacter sp.]|nr:LysM peptidoglycan-binding domain-containing protein [Luteolibacter sp.]
PRPEVVAPIPPADETVPELDESNVEEQVPAGLPQRRKLAFTLAVPLIAAIALILVLSRDKDDETSANHSTEATETTSPAATDETPTPALGAEESEPVEPAPEIAAITPPALPEPLEIVEDSPPRAPSENPPVASAPEPAPIPEAPPAPLLPDPEDGLVAAVPDTPGAVPPLPPLDDGDVGEHLLHAVRSGETLGVIAKRHDVTVDEIMHANRMRSDLLHAGQTLRIPVDPKSAENPAPSATPETEIDQTAQTGEAEENSTAPENSFAEEIPAPAPEETPEPLRHTVVRGDNLTRIARQYGCEAADIMRLNGLKNDVIHPGQSLLIPPPAN